MTTQKQKQYAFTLVEIMIVAAIISLLASICVPSFLQRVNAPRRPEYWRIFGSSIMRSISMQLRPEKYPGCIQFSATSKST